MADNHANRLGAFVIYKDWAGQYAWKLVDNRGELIVYASLRYSSLAECLGAIEKVKRFAGTAIVSETVQEPA